MPEPDFDQLARQVISGSEHHITRVAQQLRQVWNARGAADLTAINDQLRGQDVGPSGIYEPPPPRKFIRAIKKLDR